MKDISENDLKNNIQKVAARYEGQRSTTKVGNVVFGDDQFVVIGGPGAVEGEEMVLDIARAVKVAGGHMLRGGAYKPLTFPYRNESMFELREHLKTRIDLNCPTMLISRYNFETVSYPFILYIFS